MNDFTQASSVVVAVAVALGGWASVMPASAPPDRHTVTGI